MLPAEAAAADERETDGVRNVEDVCAVDVVAGVI